MLYNTKCYEEILKLWKYRLPNTCCRQYISAQQVNLFFMFLFQIYCFLFFISCFLQILCSFNDVSWVGAVAGLQFSCFILLLTNRCKILLLTFSFSSLVGLPFGAHNKDKIKSCLMAYATWAMKKDSFVTFIL